MSIAQSVNLHSLLSITSAECCCDTAMSLTVQQGWPCLWVISLRSTQLDVKSILLLTQTKWLNLSHLNLAATCSVLEGYNT